MMNVRLLPLRYRPLARLLHTASTAVCVLCAPLAHGALPTAVDPSTAPGAGDWLGVVQGYIKDGGLVVGLAISVVGFVWVSWSALAKFNEARVGRAEWGEVGLLGGVGAAILLLVTFLLTQAAGVI